MPSSSNCLSPFVYWGQNNSVIFMKVDLKDVQDPEILLTEDAISFHANGLGVQGRNEYAFELNFYSPINEKKSKYRVGERSIELQLHKVGDGEVWPRLTYAPGKPAWLRPDFDHFACDDESDEEARSALEKEEERSVMKRMDRQLKNAEKEALSDIKSLYLLIYNLFMWVGFTVSFIILSYRYVQEGQESMGSAFSAVGAQLMVVQFAAIMEVIHPLCGIVKTEPYMPLMQVFGRNFILFGLVLPEPRLYTKPVLWWLFVTWSSVELVRYPYYMLHLAGMEWKLITWLRYTLWIVLYPAGFLFEGLVCLLALPLYEETGHWTTRLPNVLNFAFHFPTLLRVYMLLMFAGGYVLMQRMYTLRKQTISGNSARHKRKTTTRANNKVA